MDPLQVARNFLLLQKSRSLRPPFCKSHELAVGLKHGGKGGMALESWLRAKVSFPILRSRERQTVNIQEKDLSIKNLTAAIMCDFLSFRLET